MLSPRAPLFSVSLAFATGCLLGLDGMISLPGALIIFCIAAVLWFVLARREKTSLAAFYALAACAGLLHTLLLGATTNSAEWPRSCGRGGAATASQSS